jgi:hypothetical protein
VVKGSSLGAVSDWGKGDRALRTEHGLLGLGIQVELDQRLDAGLADQFLQDILVLPSNGLDSDLLCRGMGGGGNSRSR